MFAHKVFTCHMYRCNRLHGNTELVHHSLFHLMNMECVQVLLVGIDKNKHELLLFDLEYMVLFQAKYMHGKRLPYCVHRLR